jgi:preprotein translocase subunit SecG
MCPSCGTAHSIPAPEPAQPVQESAPVQEVAPAQPTAPVQPTPPTVVKQPTVQKGDFCAKCGTKLTDWKTCPSGCVIGGGGSGGTGLDAFIDVSESSPKLVLGQTRIKVAWILAGVAVFIAIWFLIPWYSLKANAAGVKASEGVGGFDIIFDGTGADWLHILLLLHPLLTGAICVGFALIGDKIKEMVTAISDKVYIILAGLFGFGLLLQFIFLGAFNGKYSVNESLFGVTMSTKVVPHAGWVFALLFYLIAIALSVLCFLQEKKK